MVPHGLPRGQRANSWLERAIAPSECYAAGARPGIRFLDPWTPVRPSPRGPIGHPRLEPSQAWRARGGHHSARKCVQQAHPQNTHPCGCSQTRFIHHIRTPQHMPLLVGRRSRVCGRQGWISNLETLPARHHSGDPRDVESPLDLEPSNLGSGVGGFDPGLLK